jgi:hypothetical protein
MLSHPQHHNHIKATWTFEDLHWSFEAQHTHKPTSACACTHIQTHKCTHTHIQTHKCTHSHTHSNEFLMQPCSCVGLAFIAFKCLIYFMWTNLYCLRLHYFVYLNISKLHSWNCKCDILVPRFLLSDLYMQTIIITPFYIYFSLKTWSDPHLPI